MKHYRTSEISYQEKDKQIISTVVKNKMYILPRKPQGKWMEPASMCMASSFAARGCCVCRPPVLLPHPKAGVRSLVWELCLGWQLPLWLKSTFKRFLRGIEF